MAPQIIISGLVVEIAPDKVKIFDELGDLSKTEVILIVKYLHAEAFIFGDKIAVEVITDDI